MWNWWMQKYCRWENTYSCNYHQKKADINLLTDVLVSCYYTKYLRQSAYKKKRLILAHNFEGLSPLLVASLVFGPVARQQSQAGNVWWNKLLTSRWPGSKRRKERTQEIQVPQVPFWGHRHNGLKPPSRPLHKDFQCLPTASSWGPSL